MKKFLKNIANKITGAAKSIKEKAVKLYRSIKNKVNAAIISTKTVFGRSRAVLSTNTAEGYVDTGVKILIAVVIGALLLAGLYALFNTTIMPTVTNKVKSLFNYSGK